jgi:hypothetical protein
MKIYIIINYYFILELTLFLKSINEKLDTVPGIKVLLINAQNVTPKNYD